MDINTGLIKDICMKEISLFRELLHCVNLERENLIQIDIKALWSVMEEKQKILEAIEETREELRNLTGDHMPYNDMPAEDRKKIMMLSKNITTLKEEIKARVAENISFINESLGFFHDIFTVVANSGEKEEPYSHLGKNRAAHSSSIYYNEA